MLNINEEMDYMEDTEKCDILEEDIQDQFQFYNANYNVNFFGLGRGSEEWQ